MTYFFYDKNYRYLFIYWEIAFFIHLLGDCLRLVNGQEVTWNNIDEVFTRLCSLTEVSSTMYLHILWGYFFIGMLSFFSDKTLSSLTEYCIPVICHCVFTTDLWVARNKIFKVMLSMVWSDNPGTPSSLGVMSV